MTKPYRYERAANPPAAALWQGRPVFNLYGNDNTWIGRVADETLDRAEQHARRHAAVPLMEAALRAIQVSPDAAIALHDHPARRLLSEALRFIDHGPTNSASAT